MIRKLLNRIVPRRRRALERWQQLQDAPLHVNTPEEQRHMLSKENYERAMRWIEGRDP